VSTFIAVYSGLIPMFSTAGNTTDDGVVGAILEDCFQQAREPAVVRELAIRIAVRGEA
jgi:hypothetical protein